MNESVVTQQAAVPAQAVHQGRWGYHACSYQTFLQLKELNKICERIKRQFATHWRWTRKDPKNRVARARLRNDKGWVIGYGPATPINEPTVHPFAQNALHSFVEEAYKSARRPAPTPLLVEPLKLSDKLIDELFRQYVKPSWAA